MRTIVLALLSALLLVSSPAAAGEDIYVWSKTASSNASADSGINFQEGQVPGSLNDSMRSVMAALAKARDDQNCSTSTTGSSNAYAFAASAAFSSTPFTGAVICFKASFTNTGAATLNVIPSGGSAQGPKAIKIFDPLNGEADPAAGQIKQSGHYLVRYDSAANSSAGAWILSNPSYIRQSKVTSATRDLTAASGTVAYTGVGFKPTSLRILSFASGGSPGIYGNGLSDASRASQVVAYTSDTGVIISATNRVVLYSDLATANQQSASVSSYDSDGFTLSWTKIGTPSGTLNLFIFAEN